MKNPIFVALDVSNKDQALKVAEQVSEFVGGYKVGPRLSMKYGESLIQSLSEFGPVFVDNKYYDIPNTMEASVRATFEAGATYCTIHAQCGPEALKRLAELEKELNKQREFKILCVTILTSFSQGGLPVTQSSDPIQDQVLDLIKECQDNGLNHFVCSAEELPRVRENFPDVYVVTPGIRMSEDASGDQKRVVSPEKAMQMGANALVVGRPIVGANDPKKASRRYLDSLR